MKKPIRIAIAEDHLLLRETMVDYFSREDSIKVVLDVGNGSELLNRLKKIKVDIVLLDLNMPILNGWQTLKLLEIRYPSVRVIILSMYSSDAYRIEAIKLGARSFLNKGCSSETLVDALFSDQEEGYYYRKETTKALHNKVVNNDVKKLRIVNESLTERELQIVELICDGKTNKEISDLTSLSVRTIESHRSSISNKTGGGNVARLVVHAIKNGLYLIE